MTHAQVTLEASGCCRTLTGSSPMLHRLASVQYYHSVLPLRHEAGSFRIQSKEKVDFPYKFFPMFESVRGTMVSFFILIARKLIRVDP